MIHLSKTSIRSFAGDVVSLQLLGDSDLTKEDIRWKADGEYVHIRTFTDQDHYRYDDDRFGFNNGVLLTLLKPGTSAVTAEYAGITYTCTVSAREMKKASSDDEMQYYIGDLHVHAASTHQFIEFAKNTINYPHNFIEFVKEANDIDFTVISDHSDVINKKAFYDNFVAVENAQPMGPIIFPGAESEASIIDKDRFNLMHKYSGEVVSLNANNYSASWTWDEFYHDFAESPFAVCTLAHPQPGSGRSPFGMWSFSLYKNNTPEMKRLVRYIETGNGGDRNYNAINEYIYSVALDNGLRVSTTCSGDRHSAPWGYEGLPGKTILMAPEKSREAFLDALMHNRAYSCDSGNVKLRCTVNGSAVPCDVAPAERYDFHVEISFFREDPSTVPVRCQVISDYGKTVKVIENVDFTSFDFTVESKTARYFFLRLMDSEGRRTFSPPVWTGRPFDECTYPALTPLYKGEFTAVDEVSGENVDVLLNMDPTTAWQSKFETASIVIDMQKEREVCAMGHHAHRFYTAYLQENDLTMQQIFTSYAHRYRISTSTDGVCYTAQAEGVIRTFGEEELLLFPLHRARYIRFEVLGTVGREYGLKQYIHTPVSIGELSVFTK